MSKLIGILTINGLYLKNEDIINKYDKKALKKLKSKYTIKYRNFITKITSFIHSWIETTDKKYLILPRTTAYKLYETEIIDEIDDRIPITDTITLNYIGKPKNNQKIICDYLMENVYNEDGEKGCIIKATAGIGKTFIGFEIIKRISKKTLVIVPNSFLLNQWVTKLQELFPDDDIGQYSGKKKIFGEIIVMVINSAADSDDFTFRYGRGLYNTISGEDFYQQFGLIIYDECHKYCTPLFKKIFNRANIENILGLSATPDERIDGFDKIIPYYIGKIIDVEEIEEYEKNIHEFSSLVNTIRYNAPDDYCNRYVNPYNKLISTPKIIEELTSDPYRNKLIIDNIIKYYKEKRNIFVFSDRRSHLELLYEQFINDMSKTDKNIKSYTFIPELCSEDDEALEKLDSSILYGGSKEADINHAEYHSKVIFTTYQYSSTGVSIVKMDTLILTTPRRSYMTQIIGRIFRLGSNMDTTRIIIDLLDNKSVLKGQYSDRKKSYKDRNSIIEEEVIEYTDIKLK